MRSQWAHLAPLVGAGTGVDDSTGTPLHWVPTECVQVGDRIACLLSDASAFPVVTGWADKLLSLSRYGLADVTRRVFTVRGAPWWADGPPMCTFAVGDCALIVDRAFAFGEVTHG